MKYGISMLSPFSKPMHAGDDDKFTILFNSYDEAYCAQMKMLMAQMESFMKGIDIILPSHPNETRTVYLKQLMWNLIKLIEAMNRLQNHRKKRASS